MRIPPALSAHIHARSSALKPLVAAWRLGSYRSGALRGLPLAIRNRDDPFRLGIVVEKDAGGRQTVKLDTARLRDDRTLFSTLWKRGGVFVDLIADPDTASGSYVCDLGDICAQPGPVLAFCSNNAENSLVPDRTFYLKNGYAADRRLAAAAPSWNERDHTVLWRGGLNGSGSVSGDTMTSDNDRLLQRVRLGLAARDIRGTDIKIPVGKHFDAGLGEHYRSLRIAGGYVPQSQWTHRKFAVDIDGNSNAFSNLYTRLLYGCCVLKVASPFGFRQWYYDELKPWTHYVPVAADLSDLAERVRWCRDNDDVCQAIAAAGQRLAHGMTRDSEKRATVARINAAFAG